MDDNKIRYIMNEPINKKHRLMCLILLIDTKCSFKH